MPKMSVYIGDSNISALFYKDGSDYNFFNFPYVYASNLFELYVLQKDFYLEVIGILLKQAHSSLDECEVIVASFSPLGLGDVQGIKETSISSVLDKVKNVYPIFVNRSFVLRQGEFDTQIPLTVLEKQSRCDEFDFCTNLNIYPQIVSLNISSQADSDNSIVEDTSGIADLSQINEPLVFMGSRFSISPLKELDYVLMLSLINGTGVTDVFVDRNNGMILFEMLKELGGIVEIDVSGYLQKICTLINSREPVECLIESEIGTRQFIDVPQNVIYAVPMQKDTNAIAKIKARSIGLVEASVRDGSLGLVFDTREFKGSLFSNLKVFNQSVKSFQEAGGTF